VGSLGGTTALPQGKINTCAGSCRRSARATTSTGSEQIYFNVQKNLRQYSAYLAGGGGPWFTGSQAAFDAFADQGKPESSWTYEGRPAHEPHVRQRHLAQRADQLLSCRFSNRLLAVPTNPGGIAGSGITGGTSTLVNVGDVKTDGVDAAFTVRVGRHLLALQCGLVQSVQISERLHVDGERHRRASNTCIGGYTVATAGQPAVVPTCGKQLAGTPKWMNKTVATISVGPFEVQGIGDFVGRRFATYTNDASVPSYFMISGRIAARLPEGILPLKKAELVAQRDEPDQEEGLVDRLGRLATNSWSAYPIAPRQWFVTLSAAY
jgi:iron complex outermembrane receptor protein